MFKPPFFAMAARSCTTRQSFHVNTPTNPAEKLNELANAKGPAKKSNVKSNKALTKAYTPLEAPILPLVPPLAKNLFIKFMKVFMEMTQVWDREQLEPQKRSLKAMTPETYFGKSHMDCYHFC